MVPSSQVLAKDYYHMASAVSPFSFLTGAQFLEEGICNWKVSSAYPQSSQQAPLPEGDVTCADMEAWIH